MKNATRLAVFTALLSSLAHASIEALPAVYSPMYVVESKRIGMSGTPGELDVNSVVAITLNGERTEMTLDYVKDNEDRRVVLDIYSISEDACGSVTFSAKYSDEIYRRTGARYSVLLTDHTTQTCVGGNRRWLWEANVHSGYGWCGTGDSQAMLVGAEICLR